jgi:nicotinamidase-related amidase
VIIDMQRDFVEPGGFGETLGNDVTRLQAIVPATQRVLAAWRAAKGFVVHTRESHAPDLSDCPPRQRERGAPSLRIGDVGPMGRILVRGEPGNQIIPELEAATWRAGDRQAGQGRVPRHAAAPRAAAARASRTCWFMGVTTEVCVQTSMREANDRGYDALLLEDCTESYFPAFKAAAIEMIVAQGGIVGWCAASAQLLQAMAPLGAAA